EIACRRIPHAEEDWQADDPFVANGVRFDDLSRAQDREQRDNAGDGEVHALDALARLLQHVATAKACPVAGSEDGITLRLRQEAQDAIGADIARGWRGR